MEQLIRLRKQGGQIITDDHYLGSYQKHLNPSYIQPPMY